MLEQTCARPALCGRCRCEGRGSDTLRWTELVGAEGDRSLPYEHSCWSRSAITICKEAYSLPPSVNPFRLVTLPSYFRRVAPRSTEYLFAIATSAQLSQARGSKICCAALQVAKPKLRILQVFAKITLCTLKVSYDSRKEPAW